MSVSSSLSLIIVVLYAWAAAAGPSPIVPEEKLKQVSRGLIIGGRDAELGEFPSFVRIDIRSGSTQAMCGGVIIARNLVLTAGHCNVGENTSYTVSTSQSNQPGDEPNQEIAASRFCLAPNYTFLKSNYTLNDYAILVLEKPFTFNGYVRPASLPEQPISEDELLTAVGIGISNTRLQKIKVQQHYCPSRGEHVNSCFKLFGPEDATIEAGDSGSPIFAWRDGKRYVVAITDGVVKSKTYAWRPLVWAADLYKVAWDLRHLKRACLYANN